MQKSLPNTVPHCHWIDLLFYEVTRTMGRPPSSRSASFSLTAIVQWLQSQVKNICWSCESGVLPLVQWLVNYRICVFWIPGFYISKCFFSVGFNSNLAAICPIFAIFWPETGFLTGVVLKYPMRGVLFKSGAQITWIRYISFDWKDPSW